MATASTPQPIFDSTVNPALSLSPSTGLLVVGPKSVTSADGSVVLSGSPAGTIDLSAALAIKTADDKVQSDLKAIIAASASFADFQTRAAAWAEE